MPVNTPPISIGAPAAAPARGVPEHHSPAADVDKVIAAAIRDVSMIQNSLREFAEQYGSLIEGETAAALPDPEYSLLSAQQQLGDIAGQARQAEQAFQAAGLPAGQGPDKCLDKQSEVDRLQQFFTDVFESTDALLEKIAARLGTTVEAVSAHPYPGARV